MGKGSGIAMSCGVGLRHSSDLALLWLWCRSAAVAPIRPLAWQPPYATGAALKRKKKKKKKYETWNYTDLGSNVTLTYYIYLQASPLPLSFFTGDNNTHLSKGFC